VAKLLAGSSRPAGWRWPPFHRLFTEWSLLILGVVPFGQGLYGVGMHRTYPVILIATLITGIFGAHAYEVRLSPTAASDADNACASIAAYAQTHAEAEILPYIKSCGGNPAKDVCEQTIRMMKTADPAKGRTYGLTCVGSP
jgi:hypothetical protein